MNSDTPKYYRPYDSEEDTDNTTDSGSDESDDSFESDLPYFEDPRIRREEDPRYAIIRAAGPNFNTSAEQLKYMEHAPGSLYNPSTNITSLSNLVYLNPPKTTQTSLFSIKSINRDFSVWKTPFYFQLKTPRVYKNVTKFQLVQISFPNNTQNFVNSPVFVEELGLQLISLGVPENCVSTCVTITGCHPKGGAIGIAEMGRLNSNGEPMMTSISIPSGNYTNKELANQLTRTANNTPPFNIISFEEFKYEFKIHRDISILFNHPGEYLTTNVSVTTRTPTTKNDIINLYYTQNHIDSFYTITDKIAYNAYYFPVLKELCASPLANIFVKTGAYSFFEVKNLVLGQFLGLNSDVYYNLCQINQGTLDEYRKLFTFELTHINKYVFNYDENSKRFNILHDCLHTSLQKDINEKYNSLFNHAMSVQGLNNKTFTSLKNTQTKSNSIFKEMECYLSTQLSAAPYNVTNYQFNPGLLHSGYHSVSVLNANVTFSNIFNQNYVFGEHFHGNYHGSNYNLTGFLSFHSTMSTHYNIAHTSALTLSTIHSYANNKLHEYISTKYTGILPHYLIYNSTYQDCRGIPASFLTNEFIHTPGQKIPDQSLVAQSLSVVPASVLANYTVTEDPCKEKCCEVFEKLIKSYYSCLPAETVASLLQYRLGVFKVDLKEFSIASTIFGITQQTNFNLFLQINEFQSFNNMDIAMNENYTISNETTGQVKLMSAKILLSGVGGGEVSETAIQNPIIFDTPLGKLDKLELKIYADDETLTPLWQFFPFDIGVNEWDATFQIDEEVSFANRDTGFSGNIPTVPIPSDPAALQYMALTSTNNPNNKSFA
jgi:hypothetical protein